MPELRIVPLGPDPVGYEDAWEEQRRLHAAVAEGSEPDTVLLLEHPPVYTAGRRTEPADRPTDGTPVVEVDRGGRITWHGPGQLVGYPIVRLGEPVDVVAHVRRLEEVLIRTCADLGLVTERVAGRSGVWVPADAGAAAGSGAGAGSDVPVPVVPAFAAGIGVARPGRPERKVAAVGVRVSRGVTMHGFALNCDCDLTWFDRIVPCGIADAGVTSLTAELGRRVTVDEALPLVRGHLAEVFGGGAGPGTTTSAADAVLAGPA